MTQRWYLLIHGKVTEVTVDHYLTEAKRGQWMGITRKDGTEPTWDDFNALLSKGLGDTDIAHGEAPHREVRERYRQEALL